MNWTHDLPTQDGWHWYRQVVGSIPHDEPINIITMRDEQEPSTYWDGRWRLVSTLPRSERYFWSSAPIPTPST